MDTFLSPALEDEDHGAGLDHVRRDERKPRQEKEGEQKIFVVNFHHKFIVRQKQINFIFSAPATNVRRYLAQLINIISKPRMLHGLRTITFLCPSRSGGGGQSTNHENSVSASTAAAAAADDDNNNNKKDEKTK